MANFAESPFQEPPPDQPDPTAPAGDVYDWYVRGRDLLRSGDAAAAVQILSRTVEAEPGARSAREMLARAQFDAGQYPKARESFEQLVERDPADHYAHFGLGLAARKVGDLAAAVEHLALAAAMRPDLERYARELRAARAAAARR
ncbi:MAG TPA: tetratricopeptide repeat protein [Frankiaceae bacterium]|nr:tetratricopeptide repeat protein [Frankiaceae bacterium]